MAQGNLKLAKKAKSTTQKKLQPKDQKKGARAIPPKKEAAVSRAIIHKRHTSSHAANLEKSIAATAKTHGKLTIMRPLADEAEKQREKDKAEGKKK